MAIRSSYDSKINKTVQLKPIVLEIEKAMLHNDVHRFSDEIIFVSDDFKEVPPFIHPIYSPEKDIAFIDVRGFSSVGQDGNLTLKGDIDSELTVLRAKLELVWQRAPRSETFTALHFSNTIFVRWLSDTLCHKHGLQLGHKSKVLAVTGLYMIGLYYNSITDDYQISKYAEMVSRDFYIPLEEVFSVIDMLDNPFPRDIDEYVEALKQMQISPRLANLNTVGLYAMLGGSWFMTANASQLVGLAVEYPPCMAALVSMATRHKIFKKTQIGERVDRANKGGAFDQFTRSMNALINTNLGQINPNRQRAGMESIPYNAMIIDDEFFEQNIGMEGLTVGQGAALLVGGGFIAAFLAWLFSKFSGGGSGGGGGLVTTAETKKDNIKDKLVSTKKAEVEIAKVAHEIKSDASSNSEAMDVAIVEDAGAIVDKGGDKKILGIVDRVRNEAALPMISVAMKYEPSQEPANHWANMEALVRTIDHIEDPVQLAAIFEVYKRTLRDGDQMVKSVLTDFIKHPLFKKEIHFGMLLFSGAPLPYVQSQEMMELGDQLLEASGPEMLDKMAYCAGMLHELHLRAADDSISDEDLNKAARYQIETCHADIWMKLGSMIKRDVETDVMINGVKERVDYFWVNRRTTTRFDWPDGNYTDHFVDVFNRAHDNVPVYESYVKWLKGMEDHINTQNKSSREWVGEANEAELWKRFAPDLRQKLRDVTQVTRFMVYTTGKAISVGMEMVSSMSNMLDAYAAAQKAIEKNLQAMQKELARAGKKAGLESYEEAEGEFLPAQKGVGLEMNPWMELTARVGFAIIVGMFVEWLVRKISGGGSGGGGGSSRMSVSFRVESAGEKLVRVGETLDKTKKDFLTFNSEVNRRKLKDEDLMGLVKTDADKSTLRKFLSAIANDDHLLRLFAVLIVNGASGKDESQFTFLGVSSTDRDWEKWVLSALANFRKTSMPNEMEFEKYLLFCGMSIPGTFAIADVIESIDIPKAMNHLEVESEIVEEIFKLGDEFTDADAKRIAEEIRKGASGPASDSKEVSIPGTQGKTYAEIFRHAALSRFTIWPAAIFRNGLKADETLAEIKPDQWRTLLDTKRLSTKLAADKNTLERMESKARYLQDRLASATRKSNINGRFSSNPDDHQTITDFLGKKSQAMYEIQSYLQAVNSYTRGVEMQAGNMSYSCRTLEARIGNVKTLLNKVD